MLELRKSMRSLPLEKKEEQKEHVKNSKPHSPFLYNTNGEEVENSGIN